MWRWVSAALIIVILSRPIILIDNSVCQETAPTAEKAAMAEEAATAVDPLAATPCHDSLRMAEANTATNPHACPCPVMWVSAAAGWTAVFQQVSAWHSPVHLPETAVNVPPNPPPRLV